MNTYVRIAISIIGIIIYNRTYLYVQNAKYSKKTKLVLMIVGNVITVCLLLGLLLIGR
jgi:hypothetical protein